MRVNPFGICPGSIPGEVLDFLSKWDFITPDEATEDYDLLKWFEGDPDYLELGDDYKC